MKATCLSENFFLSSRAKRVWIFWKAFNWATGTKITIAFFPESFFSSSRTEFRSFGRPKNIKIRIQETKIQKSKSANIFHISKKNIISIIKKLSKFLKISDKCISKALEIFYGSYFSKKLRFYLLVLFLKKRQTGKRNSWFYIFTRSQVETQTFHQNHATFLSEIKFYKNYGNWTKLKIKQNWQMVKEE